MYFVTPSDPTIFLIGIYETQLYGFGEKEGKLCIYTRSVFDIGRWKELYVIDILVEKCCKNGLHVATGLEITQKTVNIWIAARENKFTQIFSLDVDTMKLTRYKMLHEIYPEFALLNLYLCCKCLSPHMRCIKASGDFNTLIITPQKYQKKAGIFEIRVSINQSKHCLLWKKFDSFKLVRPPSLASSNISVNGNALDALSINKRSKDGTIQQLSIESEDHQMIIMMKDSDDNEWIWHEVAFCDAFCISRQKENDGKSILKLGMLGFFQEGMSIIFCPLDYCTVDANFPSIDSTPFFISWRKVDKEYIPKPITNNSKHFFGTMQSHVIPSFVVFQIHGGRNIVVISFRILSLTEAAYISLAQIPQYHPLPVVQITCIHYFFQQIRKLFGFKENLSKKAAEDKPWLSIKFIKNAIGWPRILPLTNTPNLPMK